MSGGAAVRTPSMTSSTSTNILGLSVNTNVDIINRGGATSVKGTTTNSQIASNSGVNNNDNNNKNNNKNKKVNLNNVSSSSISSSSVLPSPSVAATRSVSSSTAVNINAGGVLAGTTGGSGGGGGSTASIPSLCETLYWLTTNVHGKLKKGQSLVNTAIDLRSAAARVNLLLPRFEGSHGVQHAREGLEMGLHEMISTLRRVSKSTRLLREMRFGGKVRKRAVELRALMASLMASLSMAVAEEAEAKGVNMAIAGSLAPMSPQGGGPVGGIPMTPGRSPSSSSAILREGPFAGHLTRLAVDSVANSPPRVPPSPSQRQQQQEQQQGPQHLSPQMGATSIHTSLPYGGRRSSTYLSPQLAGLNTSHSSQPSISSPSPPLSPARQKLSFRGSNDALHVFGSEAGSDVDTNDGTDRGHARRLSHLSQVCEGEEKDPRKATDESAAGGDTAIRVRENIPPGAGAAIHMSGTLSSHASLTCSSPMFPSLSRPTVGDMSSAESLRNAGPRGVPQGVQSMNAKHLGDQALLARAITESLSMARLGQRSDYGDLQGGEGADVVDPEGDALLSDGYGFLVSGQADEAYPRILEAAHLGIIRAQVILGRMFELGAGAHRSITRAVQWYIAAASRGDPDAQNSLGLLYESGDILVDESLFAGGESMHEKGPGPRNAGYIAHSTARLSRALEFYLAAVSGGHGAALYNAGRLIEKGFPGCPANAPRAMQFYVEAASRDIAEAKWAAGKLLLTGSSELVAVQENDIDPRNASRGGVFDVNSVYFHQQQQRRKSKQVQKQRMRRRNSDDEYDDGGGGGGGGCGRKNDDDDLNLSSESNGGGFEQEMPEEGNDDIDGGGGDDDDDDDNNNNNNNNNRHEHKYISAPTPRRVDRDPVAAVKWFSQAADHGFAEAYNSLGYCREQGLGYEDGPDRDAAKCFYMEAASRGSADGNFNAAYLLLEDGAFTDALPYLYEGASLGSASATHTLGLLYLNGVGVQADVISAQSLLTAALLRGCADAIEPLASIYFSGTYDIDGYGPDATTAGTLYLLAAVLGSTEAANNLAIMYQDGFVKPWHGPHRRSDDDNDDAEPFTGKGEKPVSHFKILPVSAREPVGDGHLALTHAVAWFHAAAIAGHEDAAHNLRNARFALDTQNAVLVERMRRKSLLAEAKARVRVDCEIRSDGLETKERSSVIVDHHEKDVEKNSTGTIGPNVDVAVSPRREKEDYSLDVTLTHSGGARHLTDSIRKQVQEAVASTMT